MRYCFFGFWFLVFGLLGGSTATRLYGAAPQLQFEAGNRAYLDGNFEEALGHWLDIENEGYVNGTLFYNIGNAYYKRGETGEAILYWERASDWLGEDEDLETNLKIVRAKLVDKHDETVRLPIWNWLDRVRAWFPGGTLAWIGVGFCFLLFSLLGLKRWVVKETTARIRLTRLAWVTVFVLALDFGLLYLHAHDENTRREGVLLKYEVEVLSAPAEGSGKLLFTLHEGTKVRVLRVLEDWYEISLGKDKQGWVKSRDLGII